MATETLPQKGTKNDELRMTNDDYFARFFIRHSSFDIRHFYLSKVPAQFLS